MTELVASPLEAALLGVFYGLYGKDGFPHFNDISVLKRENTGGGRYVTLSSPSLSTLADGYLDLGGRFIEMEGIPNGMMAVVAVRDGKVVELEIAVYGGYSWDGEERAWQLK